MFALSCALFAVGCTPEAAPQSATDGPAPVTETISEDVEPAIPTTVLDRDDLARLMNNSGVTLQWIDWESRGQMKVGNRDGDIWLSGTQFGRAGQSGALYLKGRVVEIGTNYFTFSGEIVIEDAPDQGRVCKMNRDDWRFEVTQNRKYWRLRQFEWCDGLTDYIDIYF